MSDAREWTNEENQSDTTFMAIQLIMELIKVNKIPDHTAVDAMIHILLESLGKSLPSRKSAEEVFDMLKEEGLRAWDVCQEKKK